jgi:hypothetical protein
MALLPPSIQRVLVAAAAAALAVGVPATGHADQEIDVKTIGVAAWEPPDLLVADLRTSFKPLR